ncbi:hypothetical protein Ddc_18985 [Ditylenchus destructor]|nr:hypothetical protein Ddc_18985 [Ditylenchus destructor]
MNKENAKVKRDLLDSQKRLKTVDKLIKEKEDMSVELKRWEHLRQLLGEATEYAEGLGKKNAENKQSLQQQSTPRLVPIMPPAAWDDVALATNEALKQELAESKAKVNAAQTRVKDLVESTCDLWGW